MNIHRLFFVLALALAIGISAPAQSHAVVFLLPAVGIAILAISTAAVGTVAMVSGDNPEKNSLAEKRTENKQTVALATTQLSGDKATE